MVFLHINNDKEKVSENEHSIRLLDNHLKSNKHVFILIYMDGCGPCNMTRPEWKKLESSLNIKKHNNLLIVDIDKDLLHNVKHLKHNVSSYPTIIHVSKSGTHIKNYEDSNIDKKDRSIDSFVDWINSEVNTHKNMHKNMHKKTHKRKIHTRKSQMGGKWSIKYKRSINCKRPRGFSQKQYCKYGRKK
jgi:thiol-disulfide isomerase/thioredoxin